MFVLILTLLALFNLTQSARLRDYVSSSKYPMIVDEKSTLSKRSLVIAPEKLIQLTKEIVGKTKGLSLSRDDLADDFAFQFPIIGPLSKDEYLGAVGQIDLKDAFPDCETVYYNFYVDPFEPNRVWYTAYFRGTHTKGYCTHRRYRCNIA